MAAASEWLNQNAYRAFPLREDVSREASNGGAVIPNKAIVDMVLVVPADVSETYYVSSLQLGPTSLALAIAAASTADVVATTEVDLSAHATNQAYNLVGVGDFSDARGRVAFGDLSDISVFLPDGLYLFEAEASALESRAVRPDLRSVRAVQVYNLDGTVSSPLSGIIRLVPGNNIRLTVQPEQLTTAVDPVTGDTVTVVSQPAGIRIDAISTPDFVEECECESSFPRPDPIRMINGVTPDVSGEIFLDGGESCISFASGGPATITVTDTCSQPCCGCPELEFITQNLILLDDSITKLTSRTEELAAREDDFYNTVLGSLT